MKELHVEIRDAPEVYSSPGIIGCQFTCVDCRQMLYNDGRSAWPWFMHECYKVKQWEPNVSERRYQSLVIGCNRPVKSIDLRELPFAKPWKSKEGTTRDGNQKD